MGKTPPVPAHKRPAHNRRATFEIEVQTRYEAGLVLTGDEVKSIRAGRIQLTGSYVRLLRGKTGPNRLPEAMVVGMHLGLAQDPQRSRRLLLSGKELRDLEEALSAKGRTAVPLRVYFRGGWAKVEVGVGPGRKQYDKRQLLRVRDQARQQARDLKGLKRA